MTATPRSTLWTDVDFDRDGKQVDWLYLHHSVTRSAYGEIMIPITVIRNGGGRTVLLMAGNHGDEYEGQIALVKLIRELEPEDIKGRVIILPAANLPAAVAGVRVSPLDGGNLNRSFPGDPAGNPTQRIAHYISSVLFPLCDGFHDLHSGGASLQYLPFASMRQSGDADLDRRSLAALTAFAPPIAIVWAYAGAGTYAASAANERKVPNLGGEFGSAGMVDRAGVALVEAGIRRFLAHFGILPKQAAKAAETPTRLMEIKGRHYYVYAPDHGVFEPAVDLGQDVSSGQLAGHVHFIDNPARPPVPCHFKASGMLICRRAMGRVERGDCVFHLATDVHT
ncbi:MAG: succinylglutamate desuccinylase/aspartoacylase family protein [Methylobacteriaceae bacterium]|nr:succinylglutamate desuccinylase/aspartoacylase family protein [Methylobacteriaceae bacterium]